MFQNCYSLKMVNFNNFDTQELESMDALFKNCSSLPTVDLSSFNTQNLRNITSLFENCLSLTSVDLSKFITHKLRRINYIFYTCPKLEYIDISSFDLKNATYYIFNKIIGSKGILKIHEQLEEQIKDQIPSGWTTTTNK